MGNESSLNGHQMQDNDFSCLRLLIVKDRVHFAGMVDLPEQSLTLTG